MLKMFMLFSRSLCSSGQYPRGVHDSISEQKADSEVAKFWTSKSMKMFNRGRSGKLQMVRRIMGKVFLVDVLGEAEGGVRGAGSGGGRLFMENPRKGGGLQKGRGRGAGSVSAADWGIGWGGAKYFFSGPKCPPSIYAFAKDYK